MQRRLATTSQPSGIIGRGSDPAQADASALRRRLAGLSADQRARLIRRLDADKSGVARSTSSSAAIPRAQPLRVEENPPVAIYPASASQQRMWFLHQYAVGSSVYNSPTAFRLEGPLDASLLEQALTRIVARHDTLRTTFAMENGELRQRVASNHAFKLRVVDLGETPAELRAIAAGRLLEEEAKGLFDLAVEPPFRALLVRLQPGEHLLVLVLHHIISDGWSRSNLCRELSEIYGGLATGRPARLAELPIQLADFSAWQNCWLEDGALAEQSTYWKAKLAGNPAPLELPADRPRPAAESFRGDARSTPLDRGLTESLRQRAQEEGATLFMILLAAFKVLLFRHAGQEDLMVGVPIANRRRVETEGLIGFFVNTLVLRTDLSGDPTFRELLRRTKATALEAYAHQDLPFEKLVEILQVRRDASRAPLFQATFALQAFPDLRLDLPGVRATLRPAATRTAKFDLSLSVERAGDGWSATLEYSTDLFDADRIERMLGHWRTLLEGVAANPDQRIGEIPLLSGAERHRLLVEWNQTERNYPRDKCVHQLFEEQVERTPDAVAVEFKGQSLTYREINAQANQLAHHLRPLGVGPDVLVGLCAERSLEMVVALLAILKAGGAYVPLDRQLARERLAFLLQDISAPVVLVQRQWRDCLPASPEATRFGSRILILEELDALAASPRTNPPCINTPKHLAYVMYTSGTTGQPKGVMVPHSGIVRLVINPDYVALSPHDILLQFAPLAFDASTFEIWGSLLNGARLVVLPARAVVYQELGRAIEAHGVTTLWLTAALFHEMMEHAPVALAGVRQLLAGGDVLSPSKVRAYLELPGHGRLINGYGPTENTTFTCCCGFDRAEQVGECVPIGRPIANTQVYLLDPRLNPVPVGTVGELCIGGAGLARGYLNAPTLTAERFLANPFSSEPGARLYRSGDMARHLPDGTIEFLGRRDRQVKIRGYRVELEEIENVLANHHGVRQGVVLSSEDESGGKTLTAWVVRRDEGRIHASQLRQFLKDQLPDYMIPSRFVVVPALPLTPNGKVDRQALLEQDLQPLEHRMERTPPKNLLELELIRIWERLFQRPDIGREDNFFDLGGHSLLAARVAAEVEKLVGQRVPIAALFQTPTPAALARRIEDEHWAPAWSSLVPLQPLGAERPLFCVHGQGGDVYGFLHLAHELAPDRPVYGLQAVGLDGRTPRHGCVEEMAAHYAREIRSFQPEGPYYLMGYSLGGWIAYEVAQQLARHGGHVAMLALLETSPTSDIPRLWYVRTMVPYLVGRVGFHLQQCLSAERAGRRHYFRVKIGVLWTHLARSWRRSRGAAPLPGAASSSGSDDEYDYFDAAVERYRPAKYAGAVDLFTRHGINRHAFWKHLALGGVRVHRVSGTHATLIDEHHAKGFAEVFKQALPNSQPGARRASSNP